MDTLITKFQQLHGKSTKQKGTYWCIPAAISNALRLLGCEEYTQEKIQEVWYSYNKWAVESDLNAPLKDMSFGVLSALQAEKKFADSFSFEIHRDNGDNDFFETKKSERALNFVKEQSNQKRPVVVSTWEICVDSNKRLFPVCCHMWLVLNFRENDSAVIHDPADDQFHTVPLRSNRQLNVDGQIRNLDVGLLGRITHSDYNCLAIWNKNN